MRRRLVYFLVRLYPLDWRERYQFEFLGLFEDAEPSWSDVADVARAAARERARALFARVPGSSDPRLRALALRNLRHIGLMMLAGVGIAVIAELLSRVSYRQIRQGSWWFMFIQLGLLVRMTVANLSRSHLSIRPGDFGERVDSVTNGIGRYLRSVGRVEFCVWLAAILIGSVAQRLDRSGDQSFVFGTIVPVVLCSWLGGLSSRRRKTQDEIDLIRSISRRRHGKPVQLP
jgi:hypothetical protein